MKIIKTISSLMVISLLCFGIAQAQQGTTAKKTATVKIQGPEIQFNKNVYDYGEIVQGANGDCEFEFTNIGNEPLLLSDVRSSCGCTTPSWPREPIMPGKKSKIKVHYDTNRVGGISKTITVTTNGQTDRVVLRISGNISPKAN